MKVVAFIPFRDAGCDWRGPSKERVLIHLDTLVDDVVICDAPGVPFSRGAALNVGIDQSDADIVVAHDGDVIVDPDAFAEAIRLAAEADGMVQPFDKMLYLKKSATHRIWKGPAEVKPIDVEHTFQRPNVPLLGTVNVLSRRTWELSGGWLDSFRGWGCEDIAFAEQCNTLVARTRRVRGDLLHLWHPKSGAYVAKATIERNRQAMKRVQAAAGDPVAMRALVEENR